jgi:hypothetical protein
MDLRYYPTSFLDHPGASRISITVHGKFLGPPEIWKIAAQSHCLLREAATDSEWSPECATPVGVLLRCMLTKHSLLHPVLGLLYFCAAPNPLGHHGLVVYHQGFAKLTSLVGFHKWMYLF